MIIRISFSQLYGAASQTDQIGQASYCRLALAACLSLTLVLSESAKGQDWNASPLFELGMVYDDNPRLEDDEAARDQYGGLLDIGLQLQRRTQTSLVQISPRANIRSYPDDSDLDSEDFYLDVLGSSTGQRSEWSIGADIRQEQVLRSETPVSDPDDPRLDDDVTNTVSVRERRQREKLRIQPAVSFDLTERSSLKFDLNYIDVSFDNQELGNAVDFSTSNADLSIARDIGQNSSVEFGVFASRYETDDGVNDTKTTGFRARISNEISETTNLYAEAGWQSADIELTDAPGIVRESTENSLLARAGFDKQWQRSRLRASIEHGQSPAGSGFIVERTQIRGAFNYMLTQRASLLSGAVFLTSETLGIDAVTASDLDYIQAFAGLAYELSRTWSLRTTYTFEDRDDVVIGSQTSNRFEISLAYVPQIEQR